MFGWLVAMSEAFAWDCAKVELDEVKLALDGAMAVEIRGMTGGLRIVSGDGDQVKARGWACSARTTIELARKDDVIVATVAGGVEGLEVELCVPRTLPALTVEGHTGPVAVDDVPARIAVERGTGPVGIHEAGSVRIAHLTGPVEAEEIAGDLVLEHVVGPLVARDVRGEVKQSDVTGPVQVH